MFFNDHKTNLNHEMTHMCNLRFCTQNIFKKRTTKQGSSRSLFAILVSNIEVTPTQKSVKKVRYVRYVQTQCFQICTDVWHFFHEKKTVNFKHKREEKHQFIQSTLVSGFNILCIYGI